MNDAPAIDEDALSVVRDIMENEFPELVDSYLAEASRLIADLERAAAASDPGGLQRAAHSLKSSSANIGAARLAATARQLEAKGRSGDLSGAGSLVDSAKPLFDSVRRRLAVYLPD